MDLDGDGAHEKVIFDADEWCILFDDGEDQYRSRDKWLVVQAFLGDTDGNSLPEVIALMDDENGRHLGLFAWMGDRYRERMVTGPLVPRPLALEIIAADTDPGSAIEGSASLTGPDLLVLSEEIVAAQRTGTTRTVRSLYRWNGFGFTCLRPLQP